MSIYAPPDISTYGDTSDGVALTFLFISTPGFISTYPLGVVLLLFACMLAYSEFVLLPVFDLEKSISMRSSIGPNELCELCDLELERMGALLDLIP